MAIIRGTTPTILFKFPFETSDISKFRMYFLQGNKTLFVKDESEIVFSGKAAQVTLTQEETLQFNQKKRLEIRTRFVYGELDSVAGTRAVFLDVVDTGEPDTPIETDTQAETE
jgi:hypothetical protein